LSGLLRSLGWPSGSDDAAAGSGDGGQTLTSQPTQVQRPSTARLWTSAPGSRGRQWAGVWAGENFGRPDIDPRQEAPANGVNEAVENVDDGSAASARPSPRRSSGSRSARRRIVRTVARPFVTVHPGARIVVATVEERLGWRGLLPARIVAGAWGEGRRNFVRVGIDPHQPVPTDVVDGAVENEDGDCFAQQLPQNLRHSDRPAPYAAGSQITTAVGIPFVTVPLGAQIVVATLVKRLVQRVGR